MTARLSACLYSLTLIGCASATPAASVRTAPHQSSPHFASPYAYEWFIRAEVLRSTNHLPQALDAYRAALASSDEDAELLARYGSALAESGDTTHAGEVLDEARTLDPENEAVWLALAALSEQRGALDDAYIALEHAERAAPLSARAPLQLAEWLSSRGHHERAQAVLERFYQRSVKGSRDAHRAVLAAALASMDPERVFAATLAYRLGVPPSAAAQLNRAATLLLDRGRPARAARVLALVPEAERNALTELRVLNAVGSAAALEAWLSTHEASDPDARLQAAHAALYLGKLDEAQAILASERLTQPESPALQLLAAEHELAAGQPARAASLFAGIPEGTTVSAEVKRGLSHSLDTLGLTTLSAELGDSR